MAKDLCVVEEDMSQRFHIVYDGSALDTHVMDVRDLAPAMLAINDLLTNANKEINGDKLKVELKVKANFKQGSFGIEFIEHLHWVSQVKHLLLSDAVTAAANASGLIGLIGLFGGGVIALYKKLKGEPPLKIEENLNGAKVFYSETEYMEVSKEVLRLYRNKTIASDLKKMLEPLDKDGIDSFYVVKDDDKENVALFISSDEVPYFKFQDTEDDLGENISISYLQIDSLTFREKNKWKFAYGDTTISASILDDLFLQNIDNGEIRFGKGDLLKVKLRTSQKFSHGKLKIDYEIIEVLEHKIVRQGNLEF